MYLPNRDALKKLSELNIDAQFAQQAGTQVFNKTPDGSQEYADLCTQLNACLTDLIAEAQSLQALVPIGG